MNRARRADINRKIVRNQQMRQDTLRRARAAQERKHVSKKPTPVVHVSRGKVITAPEAPGLPTGPNVLFTGGIGDFIAIESFMSTAERNGVRQVYLATRAGKAIQAILESAPIFPRVEGIVNLHDDWSDVFCVVNKEHLVEESRMRGWGVERHALPHDLIDYSIWYVFSQIKDGHRIYNVSNMLKHCLADVSHFQLPDDYAFVQPYSPNDRQGGGRDFNGEDWDATLRHLARHNRKGVVVLNSDDYVPADPLLMNLSNRTSITQAIEIAKRSKEYIGVDSCFAALVPKFLPEDRIFIKTVNDHYKANLDVYCAPKRHYGFVVPNLSQKI